MAIKPSSSDHQTFDAVPLDAHRIGLAQFVLCRMNISEEKVALFALDVPQTKGRFLVILFYTKWERRRFLDDESSLCHTCCCATWLSAVIRTSQFDSGAFSFLL